MNGRDAVVPMALNGLAPRAIAAELGLRRETVYTELSRARRNGIDIPRFSTAGGPSKGALRLTLRPSLAQALRPDAEARGMSVNELVKHLLQVIAEEGLVTAVLDDRGGADG